ALPRGVVVRGKVVESGTGKALESASLVHVPQRENNANLPSVGLAAAGYKHFTGPDGTFRAVLPPGAGHLLVTGPSPDYVYQSVSEQELQAGKPGGAAQHAHAVVPLTLRTKEDPKEVKVELRRAVTIKAQLVGPDGKPVKDAVVFLPSELMPP